MNPPVEVSPPGQWAVRGSTQGLRSTIGLKARVKVMKGLKVRECARVVLDGFVTWYNFLTPHEALGGRTPAMAAGIAKEPLDWKTLIELALKAPKKNPKVPLEWREKFGIF